MSSFRDRFDMEAGAAADRDDPTGRLRAYLAHTEIPLDLLALVTLWIVVIPPGLYGDSSTAYSIALTVRILLSVIYGVDAVMRAFYAQRHVRYLFRHPVVVLSVILPPLRILFSFRLIRSLFRRGNIDRFLIGASLLLLNGAAIVYYVERNAAGSNIKTFGNSLWWSIVTVTTIGYGDYTPVTVAGRIVGSFVMGIGILVLAVITAQVSSSFVDQAARRRAGQSEEDTAPTVTLTELGKRLERIEALLAARTETDQ